MRTFLTIRWLLLLLALAVLETACGPIRATTGMVDARRAIGEAEIEGADSVALYEMSLAREYLGKANEELGYNDYYMAEQLAIKAIELAELALEKTIGSAAFEAERVDTVVETPDMEELPDWGEVDPDWGAEEEPAGDLLDQEDPWGSYTPSTGEDEEETP